MHVVEFLALLSIPTALLAVFMGSFTYINHELLDGRVRLSPMALGFVHFAFLPSPS